MAYRGLAHAKMGSHTPALEDFARAIELAPRFPVPYGGRALVFVAQGRFNEAIDSCNRAISLGLRDAAIYKTRAVAHLGLGDIEKAWADQMLAELGSSAH